MGLLDKVRNIPNNPLAMASLGLLSMPTQSHHPINPLQYAMQGMQMGVNNQQNQQALMAQQEDMQMRQAEYAMRVADYQRRMQADMEAKAQEAAQKAALEEALKTLPPSEQAIARALGPEYLKLQAESMFREEKGPQSAVGKRAFDLQQMYGLDPQTAYARAQSEILQEKQAGASSVNVNTAKPPTGYAWSPDGASLVPITGGPADPNTPKPPSAEIQRANIAITALENGINEYEALLEDFDPRNPVDQFSPQKTAQIASLVADLRMQMKEAQMLGALTGPDVEILERLLSDPATMRGAWYGKGGLKKQIEETRKAIQRRQSATNAETGRGFKQPMEGAVIIPGAPNDSNVVDWNNL